MGFCVYISVLIITLALLLKGLDIAKNSPSKIKIIAAIAIMAMSLRYIVLIVLFIVNNIKYLYILKPLFFINIVAIPMIALVMLYIFMRRDSLNFAYNFICTFILIIFYCAVNYIVPVTLKSMGQYGYTMIFNGHVFVYWTYICFNTVFLFVALSFMNKKSINKLGMILIILSSLVTIVETLMWIMGVRLCIELIIGDILWIITLLYGLNKVKRKNKN